MRSVGCCPAGFLKQRDFRSIRLPMCDASHTTRKLSLACPPSLSHRRHACAASGGHDHQARRLRGRDSSGADEKEDRGAVLHVNNTHNTRIISIIFTVCASAPRVTASYGENREKNVGCSRCSFLPHDGAPFISETHVRSRISRPTRVISLGRSSPPPYYLRTVSLGGRPAEQ